MQNNKLLILFFIICSQIFIINALNPQYEEIGKGFIAQYYAWFDDHRARAELVHFYSPTDSFMTYEGQQIQGSLKISEKLNSLSFKKITRVITAVDYQPMFDGGVLMNVVGRFQADEDPPRAYTQVFVLKSSDDTYFCQHDIFRLNDNDTA